MVKEFKEGREYRSLTYSAPFREVGDIKLAIKGTTKGAIMYIDNKKSRRFTSSKGDWEEVNKETNESYKIY